MPTTQLNRIEIVVPTAEFRDAEVAPVRPVSRPSALAGKSVAFLANWKPISVPFMESLARGVAKQGGIRVAYVGFPGWRFTHPELVKTIGPELDRMASQADLVVSGVAD